MKDDTCDKRKGILEALQEGVWKSIAFTDPQCKHPTVFGCKHEADSALTALVVGAMQAGVLTAFEVQDDQQFRFTFTDALPDDLDDPVTDMSEACAHLGSIMRRGP